MRSEFVSRGLVERTLGVKRVDGLGGCRRSLEMGTTRSKLSEQWELNYEAPPRLGSLRAERGRKRDGIFILYFFRSSRGCVLKKLGVAHGQVRTGRCCRAVARCTCAAQHRAFPVTAACNCTREKKKVSSVGATDIYYRGAACGRGQPSVAKWRGLVEAKAARSAGRKLFELPGSVSGNLSASV